MGQGIFGGATSYEEQSLRDIIQDIERWIEYTSDIKKILENGIEKSKENGFWNQVPWNFQATLVSSVSCQETFLHDFSIILKAIKEDYISSREVDLLRKIGVKSREFNNEYGRTYKEEYGWKKYGEADFRVVEQLYASGRDFFVSLQDASNAASRLSDYINTKPIVNQNAVNQNIYGSGNRIVGINNGSVEMNNVSNGNFNKEIESAIPKIRAIEEINDEQKEFIIELLHNTSKTIASKDTNGQESCKEQLKSFLLGVGDKAYTVLSVLGSFASIAGFFGLIPS